MAKRPWSAGIHVARRLGTARMHRAVFVPFLSSCVWRVYSAIGSQFEGRGDLAHDNVHLRELAVRIRRQPLREAAGQRDHVARRLLQPRHFLPCTTRDQPSPAHALAPLVLNLPRPPPVTCWRDGSGAAPWSVW